MDFILTDPGGSALQLPVNPEEVTIRREKQYETVNIMNLGEIDFPTGEKVKDITFSSFFPKEYDPSFCCYADLPDPQEAMNKLTAWMISRKPVRLNITGTIINAPVLISAHTSTFKGGYPGDVYYQLSCRTWREIKVRTAAEAAASSSLTGGLKLPRQDLKPVAKEYKVKPGDSLWAIAKLNYGNGSRWKDIYANNKKIIGPNPDLIYPGMKLVMPE